MVIFVFFVLFLCVPTIEALNQIHLFCPVTESQRRPIWEDKESIRGQTQRGGKRKKLLPRCETISLVSSSGETVFWWDKKGQDFFRQKNNNKKANKTCSLLFFLYAVCFPSTDNTSTLVLVNLFWPLAIFFPFSFVEFGTQLHPVERI